MEYQSPGIVDTKHLQTHCICMPAWALFSSPLSVKQELCARWPRLLCCYARTGGLYTQLLWANMKSRKQNSDPPRLRELAPTGARSSRNAQVAAKEMWMVTCHENPLCPAHKVHTLAWSTSREKHSCEFFLLTVLRCKERRLVQSTRLIAMRVYSTALTQITPAIAIHNLQSPAHSFTALDNQLANKRSTIREIYIRYAQYVGLGMPLQLPLSPAHTRLDMARAVPTIWQETRH